MTSKRLLLDLSSVMRDDKIEQSIVGEQNLYLGGVKLLPLTDLSEENEPVDPTKLQQSMTKTL